MVLDVQTVQMGAVVHCRRVPTYAVHLLSSALHEVAEPVQHGVMAAAFL